MVGVMYDETHAVAFCIRHLPEELTSSPPSLFKGVDAYEYATPVDILGPLQKEVLTIGDDR